MREVRRTRKKKSKPSDCKSRKAVKQPECTEFVKKPQCHFGSNEILKCVILAEEKTLDYLIETQR